VNNDQNKKNHLMSPCFSENYLTPSFNAAYSANIFKLFLRKNKTMLKILLTPVVKVK